MLTQLRGTTVYGDAIVPMSFSGDYYIFLRMSTIPEQFRFPAEKTWALMCGSRPIPGSAISDSAR